MTVCPFLFVILRSRFGHHSLVRRGCVWTSSFGPPRLVNTGGLKMQLLKVAECLQDGGQHESDYDSQGSDSERSDRDPESQVRI